MYYVFEGGGGTPDLMGWGRHWTSKCMGHIESKIKNFKGILRLFTPYFYWRVCHIKVQRHMYTNYVFSYCPKYILQYSLFEQTPFRPIYLARSNDYWSIIIWLAREFVEFNRANVE